MEENRRIIKIKFMGEILGVVIGFVISTFLMRWIFKVEQIHDCLKAQNEYTLRLTRMVYRQLLESGISKEDIDEILENGIGKNK